MSVRTKLLALAAVAAVGGGASAAQAQVEIEWWHAMGGELGKKVDQIASDFNAMQDDYAVKAVYKGDYTETMTAAIAAFRAGEQPHIVQVFEVGTATMMGAKGAIKPVHEIMSEYVEGWDPDAYLPAVKSYYTTPEGDLLSLPFNSSTPVLWYNQDALNEAGVESVPETWAEMEAASKKLMDAGYSCGFSSGWQSWVHIENMSAWHNQPIGTQENGFAGFDTELVFNDGVILRHISDMAGWAEDGVFKYGGRRGDSLPLFVTGECPMWMNSSAYYAAISEQADFAFGQSMLPYYDDVEGAPQNSIIGGATLWVLAGHADDEYEAAAQFFHYLSSPEVQADWHQSSGYVPITTAAYELSQEQGFYEENPGTDTAIKQLSLNEPTPNSKGLRFGNFVQVRDVINEELEAVWAGDKTAEEALDTAVERGNTLLRQFENSVTN